VSAAAEPEFRTEGAARIQVSSALDEAVILAARLVDMLLYDVPNLRLRAVRVDVYSTFAGEQGAPRQLPILTTTAYRDVAEGIAWDALTPAEILGRFETRFKRAESGEGLPIELEPVEGERPAQALRLAGASS
jgi:hypothetical protein